MLCRNSAEALNFLAVIVLITLGLIGISIADWVGWIHWDWFDSPLVLGTWFGLLFLGICIIGLSPMR